MGRLFASPILIALVIFLASGIAFSDIKLKEPESFEMKVKGVGTDPYTNSQVVILERLDGKLALPIWIGPSEAQSILIEIEHITMPRPMTHDLLKNILKEMKADVTKVTISDLRDNTFYATISLNSKDSGIAIDSRPSDAIALALRFKAPIYVAKAVLDKAKVFNIEKPVPGEAIKAALGVDLQDVTPDLAEHFALSKADSGVLVANVGSGSKAELSGLKRGDIIISLDGDKVENLAKMGEILAKAPKEKGHKLVVLREKKSLNIELKP